MTGRTSRASTNAPGSGVRLRRPRTGRGVALGCAWLLGAVGCTGVVTSPTPRETEIEEAIDIVCDEAAARPPTTMARLTQAQYEATIRRILEESVGSSDADAVWSVVSDTLSHVPQEAPGDHTAPYTRMEQSVSPEHVVAYYEVGLAVAEALTSDSGRAERLLACPGARDAACIESFVRRFGGIVYRRPLADEDVALLTSVYDDSITADAVHNVVAVILNAPELSYQVELGTDTRDGIITLSDHEVLNRLAYVLWDAPPDEALRAMVDAGALDAEEGYAAVVDRMIADPRTDTMLARLATEWLTPLHYARLDQNAQRPDVAEYYGADAPSPRLHEVMMAEVADSFVYHVRAGDSVGEWLASPYSFARTADLARIYDVEPWDGEAAPVRFSEPERAGLLTRAAMLASSKVSTEPIIKGVTFRRQLLCDFIGAPPNGAANTAIETEGVTTRVATQLVTEQAGTSCAGCHARLINPLGFVTENFDTLGRVRTEEALFTADGSRSGSVTIERDPVFPEVMQGSREEAVDAHDLTSLIIESGKVEACVSRQIVRYAMARPETAGDGCAMVEVRDALLSGESVLDALRSYLLRPEFRERVVEGGGA